MKTIPRLKKQLKAHGITQQDVANVAGVDRTMVNKVLNERAKSSKVVAVIRRSIDFERGRV